MFANICKVIAQDLTSTPTQASWAGSCYAIACAVSMPLFSLLSDVFGRGIMATSSLGILTLGIMLLSAAENIQVLIMGRTVQGMGAGGISITCLRIFTDIVPALQWSRYYSVMSVVYYLRLLKQANRSQTSRLDHWPLGRAHHRWCGCRTYNMEVAFLHTPAHSCRVSSRYSSSSHRHPAGCTCVV
jgi:hypothetical protein